MLRWFFHLFHVHKTICSHMRDARGLRVEIITWKCKKEYKTQPVTIEELKPRIRQAYKTKALVQSDVKQYVSLWNYTMPTNSTTIDRKIYLWYQTVELLLRHFQFWNVKSKNSVTFILTNLNFEAIIQTNIIKSKYLHGCHN